MTVQYFISLILIIVVIWWFRRKPPPIQHDSYSGTRVISTYTHYARKEDLETNAYLPTLPYTYVCFPPNTILYVIKTKKKNNELWLKVVGKTTANFEYIGWIKAKNL